MNHHTRRIVLAIVLLLAPAAFAADLADHYDVVIAGAGTGGTAAAVAAGRLGVSVLLVEPTDWVGGQAFAAAVTSMDEASRDLSVRSRGLYAELVRRGNAHYDKLNLSTDTCYNGKGHFCLEPRVGRAIFLSMLAGTPTVTLSLQSTVTKVVRDGDRITGLDLAVVSDDGKTTTHHIACTVLIDATEYGDVLPLTGATYRIGNRLSDQPVDPALPDPPMQDNTWTAVIREYESDPPEDFIFKSPPPNYTPEHFARGLAVDGSARNERPWNFDRFVRYRGMPDSHRMTQAQNGGKLPTRTHINFTNDYPFSVNDVEQPDLREQREYESIVRTLGLAYYIQHDMGLSHWAIADDEGYDGPYNQRRVEALIAKHPDLAPYRTMLVNMPVMPYVRESRRIVGLYTLTTADIRRDKPHHPRDFITSIAIADYPVDVHGSHSPAVLETDLDPVNLIPHKWGDNGMGPFQIPLGCLIPIKIDGLLAAEKNISQSRLANGATRLQPSTMLTGQAAGTLAALAALRHEPPRFVPAVLVQQKLLEARDPLTRERFDDLKKDDPLFIPAQLAVVHGALTMTDQNFHPDAAPTDADRAALMQFGVKDIPATRVAAAKIVADLLLKSAEGK
ncbi:MAG: FAD-dependent oxidoreductase [Planctomycetes bacterium]|nr:FAD-dependent oxidoreductase [Planctomycetota bacterium]